MKLHLEASGATVSGRSRLIAQRALAALQITAFVSLMLLALLGATSCSLGENSSADESLAVSATDFDGEADGAAVEDEAAAADDAADAADPSTADSSAANDADSKSAASDASGGSDSSAAANTQVTDAEALRDELDITEDYRESFVHGEKPADYQRYIVLHDTEGSQSAQEVIDWWDSNGNLVAAHFVVNKDGSVWQCVPLDKIAHHAGYGDTGHNVEFGTNNESRDDKKGTTSIGSDFADYGMNSYSIGIEMVHQGGGGDYPKAQLEAVDKLIAYIDAYFGFESQIIDHKAWRSGNSDTSEEFADYLASYQAKRTHK